MRNFIILATVTGAAFAFTDSALARTRILDDGITACSVEFAYGAVPSNGATEVQIGTFDPNVLDNNFNQCDPTTFTPFSINIAGTTYSSLFVNEDGIVSFGGAVSSPAGTILSDLGLPVFAPFFADGALDGQSSLQIGYTRTSEFRGVDSMWLTWSEFIDPNNPNAGPNIFQMAIVSQGGGDFDLIFNYQALNWDNSSTGAQAGFFTGPGSSVLLPGAGVPGAYLGVFDPFSDVCNNGSLDTALACNAINDGLGLASDDFDSSNGLANGYYLFRFRDGAWTGASSEVPLPGAFLLMFAGIAGLRTMTRRAPKN